MAKKPIGKLPVVAKKLPRTSTKYKKLKPKKPKAKKVYPVWEFPPLSTAEINACKRGDWKDAAKAYTNRVELRKPVRAFYPIAEFYRAQLRPVLAEIRRLRQQ